LAPSVSNFEIHSEGYQPLENRELVALDGIKHWSLLEIINMVMKRTITLK
jgi:hypothetical protein